jgi:hypothetical protein
MSSAFNPITVMEASVWEAVISTLHPELQQRALWGVAALTGAAPQAIGVPMTTHSHIYPKDVLP